MLHLLSTNPPIGQALAADALERNVSTHRVVDAHLHAIVVAERKLMGVAALTIFVVAVCGVLRWRRQSSCKHDKGVMETRACDAICLRCGKNLGFIGALKNRGQP